MKISSKKDKPYSSWTGSGVAVRDARHDKPSDEWKGRIGKKDKQGCKGQVGKEHKPVWKLYEEVKNNDWWIGLNPKRPKNSEQNWCALVCTRCHRILEWDRSGQMAKKLRSKK